MAYYGQQPQVNDYLFLIIYQLYLIACFKILFFNVVFSKTILTNHFILLQMYSVSLS